ncbi:hypothetical protein EZS27_013080 [termite gut metagenome]|uniref:Uncharacterized protein n=1 Tax=termite gut metagenome TaxID=433724 RepID=A0A5J4RZF6_9ZZZZ
MNLNSEQKEKLEACIGDIESVKWNRFPSDEAKYNYLKTMHRNRFPELSESDLNAICDWYFYHHYKFFGVKQGSDPEEVNKPLEIEKIIDVLLSEENNYSEKYNEIRNSLFTFRHKFETTDWSKIEVYNVDNVIRNFIWDVFTFIDRTDVNTIYKIEKILKLKFGYLIKDSVIGKKPKKYVVNEEAIETIDFQQMRSDEDIHKENLKHGMGLTSNELNFIFEFFKNQNIEVPDYLAFLHKRLIILYKTLSVLYSKVQTTLPWEKIQKMLNDFFPEANESDISLI